MKRERELERCSVVQSPNESKFCISFGNQGPGVSRTSAEAQNPSCVKFPQLVMIWDAMSAAGVGPACCFNSGVTGGIASHTSEAVHVCIVIFF